MKRTRHLRQLLILNNWGYIGYRLQKSNLIVNDVFLTAHFENEPLRLCPREDLNLQPLRDMVLSHARIANSATRAISFDFSILICHDNSTLSGTLKS